MRVRRLIVIGETRECTFTFVIALTISNLSKPLYDVFDAIIRRRMLALTFSFLCPPNSPCNQFEHLASLLQFEM
jgi:hypothetical protein